MSPKEKILKKNNEINLQSTQEGFIFDSNSFNVGDKMYFKIKAKDFNEESIFYEFCDVYQNIILNIFMKIIMKLPQQKQKLLIVM